MTIQELHSNIRLMVPEMDGRYFSSADLDNFIHLSVTDLFEVERKAFEESQKITETMAFFRGNTPIAISAGVGTLPSDLVYISNLMCTKIGANAVQRDVTLATEQFLNNLIISESFGPTETDILVERIAGALKVLPLTVTELTITYLRRPVKAKFGYTTSIDGFSKVYDVSTSVQIDFPDLPGLHNEIMNKTLRYIGVPLQRPVLVQEEAISKAGNQPEAR